jgi:hypothetical protein
MNRKFLNDLAHNVNVSNPLELGGPPTHARSRLRDILSNVCCTVCRNGFDIFAELEQAKAGVARNYLTLNTSTAVGEV